MVKHLHIVCLTVPYPPDYGGAIDLYYKLKHLSAAGVKIHLHCFEYGRGHQEALNQYCEEVRYYKRRSPLSALFSTLPYIVSSRENSELFERLKKDDHPVLLEGIHCTHILINTSLGNRRIFVRLHNVEYKYYKYLASAEKNIFKKYFFKRESDLLKKYEKRICTKAIFISVSEKDLKDYIILGANNIFYLPVFLYFDKVTTLSGRSTFCLYHGDLSVAENEKAVCWLLPIFKEIGVPFVIAGKNPSLELVKLAEKHDNVCLVKNPSETEMRDLVHKAHINVIPSFNATGIKLKLLNALFNGRHCIVNPVTVMNSELSSLCHICNDQSTFKIKILELMPVEFTEADITLRAASLNSLYNNKQNAEKLIQAIW